MKIKTPTFVLLSALYSIFLIDASIVRSAPKRDLEFTGILNRKNLDEFIKTYQIKTRDEFLMAMPDRLMSNFTFGIQVEGADKHCASAKTPTAIVFSGEDAFIMRFNGHPNCKNIEILEFDEQKDEILTSKTIFPSYPHQSNDSKINHASISYQPHSCIRCHGSDTRVFFGTSYPLWPGFLGSENDRLERVQEEMNIYLDNIKDWKKNSPYRFLKWDAYKEKKSFSEKMNDTFDRIDKAVSFRGFTKKTPDVFPYYANSKTLTYENRPNTRLQTLLEGIYSKRTARVVQKSKFYQRYQYLLLAHWASCSWLLEDPYVNSKDPYVKSISNIAKLSKEGSLFASTERNSIHGEQRSTGWPFIDEMGITPQDLTLKFGPQIILIPRKRDLSEYHRYNYTLDGNIIVEDYGEWGNLWYSNFRLGDSPSWFERKIEDELFIRTAKSNPEFERFFQLTVKYTVKNPLIQWMNHYEGYIHNRNARNACSLLEVKHQENMKFYENQHYISQYSLQISPKMSTKIFTSRCMSCHDLNKIQDPTNEIEIPFLDLQTLKAQPSKTHPERSLKEEILYRIEHAPPNDQMPPKEKLTKEEILMIKNFLDE